MTLFRLIRSNIAYHRRMHAGLLVGVALAGAILTGALLVGDSVDYTLEAIAGARLGRVAFAVDRTNRPFDERLAENVQARDPRLSVSAVVRLAGMLGLPPERQASHDQLNRVQVLGVDSQFFTLAETPARIALEAQTIAVNEKTARALDIRPGDDLVLRVMRQNRMPLDAPLAARKDAPAAVSVVTVTAVLDDAQLGCFSLSANQITPYNVFVDRGWLQDLAGEGRLANVLLAGGEVAHADAQRALDSAWDLEDVGLRLRAHPSGVIQLESDSVFVDEAAVRAGQQIPGSRPMLTYLVNSISHKDRMTPYSFVEAGPVPADMPGGQVVISQWLADELGAGPGATLDVAYLKLLANNTFAEQTRAFTVHRVVAMEELAVERDLAPQFPGLSDVESCSDWSVGMPMDEARLKDPANEAYWRNYGQTPKLLLAFEDGRQMWGNQFGSVTAVRFGGAESDIAEVAKRLRQNISADKIGLEFVPVREIGQTAVKQSMDFGGLFLGMSFFLIVAALILVGLLYVFGLQQRAPEIATLTALGFSPSRIRGIFLLESAPTTVAGAALGAIGGAGYAKLLLAALARFWPAAVAGTPVVFHAVAGTMAIGGVIVVCCAMLVVLAALWRASAYSVRELFATDFASVAIAPQRRNWALLPPTAALVAAVGISLGVWLAQPQSYTLYFFAVGGLMLLALLGYGRWLLLWLAGRESFTRPRVWKLALANLTRRRGRTLSVAGLTACGCFLVFAVSSMQENVALNANDRGSGTGGFAVFAETTIPVSGSAADVAEMMKAKAVALRVRDGDDAGCLNLNRAQLPRLFGVNPEAMSDLGAFVEKRGTPPTTRAKKRGGVRGDVWNLLSENMADGAAPAMIGDSNTAMWGLKKKVGDTLPYRDERGREFAIRVVGVLPMRLSLFQGSLLISDEVFTRLFPSESGFRAFLIDAGDGPAPDLARRLNRDLDQYGMQAVPAVDRLREFYAVESTYLAMFLVLGGLGLVLGAGGIGVVVLRNGFERRGEFALLDALGYEKGTMMGILLAENGALAGAGILVGMAAAAVSIVPIAVYSRTSVSVAVQCALIALIIGANAAAVITATLLAMPKVPADHLREE
ncbi:MAG TPA: ABC transporter permease [Candidatus Bathyarchaeia archaeon]|nr:ABC transporter permease [Candidatus Bathyarchaeia archaeon]